MNMDQGSGIAERWAYAAIAWLVMSYGPKLGLTASDVPWLTLGLIGGVGSVYAWWHNRPVAVLNRAGAAVPKTAQLVIQPGPGATMADVATVQKLARKAKVVAGG